MPSIIFATGWENGLPAAWIPLGTSPTAVIDGPIGSGTYAFDFTTSAAECFIEAGPSITGATAAVFGFAFKLASCTTSAVSITYANGPASSFPGIDVTSAHTLTTASTLPSITSPTLTLNTWYWVDFMYNVATSTYTAAMIITNLVTGNVLYNSGIQTVAGTAGSLTHSYIGFGSASATTFSYRLDDVVVSTTATDYPLGPHHVLGLVPSSYDATDTVTSTDLAWNNGTTNNQALTTGLPAAAIAEVPWTSTVGTSSTYVKQVTGSSSANAAFYITWANAAFGVTADAVCGLAELYLESGSSSSTPIVQAVAGGSGGTVTVISNTAITSSSTAAYTVPVVITPPAGGWTTTNLLATLIEFGQATVTASPPCLGNVMLEAALPYTFPTAPPLVLSQAMKRASYF